MPAGLQRVGGMPLCLFSVCLVSIKNAEKQTCSQGKHNFCGTRILRWEIFSEIVQPGVLVAVRSTASGSSTRRAASQGRTSQESRLPIAQAWQCPHQQNVVPHGLSRARMVLVVGSTDSHRQAEAICHWDPSTEPKQGQSQHKTTYNT